MPTASRRFHLVMRSIRASLTGDSSVIGEVFSPNVRVFLSGPALSAVEFAVEVEDRGDAFVDVQLGTLQWEDFGTHCWVEWFAAVTHAGELAIEDRVFEATGQRAVVHGVTIAEFDGDRIVAYRQSCDWSELTRPGR